jgi:hypothetical protein
MRRALLAAVFVCSFAPSFANAEHMVQSRAFIVSVDLKAKSLVFKWPDFEGKWQNVAATWNEKTEWGDATANEDKPMPATRDLVKTLKKDSKVFLRATDGVLESLETLPSTAVVK